MFWRSRVLIWGTGCLAVLVLGVAGSTMHAFDAGGLSETFGRAGDTLLAPAVRWDAVWYLRIAEHGYSSGASTGFYPFYPLLIHLAAMLWLPPVIAGLAIALVASFIGMVVVRRLTELEFGRSAATVVVPLMAFSPMALFLSAVYTEPLYLALSAGSFLAGRRGRWPVAGVLGGLAAVTRLAGVVLVVPLLLLYLYGPREDRPGSGTRPAARWRPRYQLRRSALWMLLVPAGAALFPAYLAMRGFGAAATLQAQQTYHVHHLALPVTGAWDGVMAAVHQVGQLVGGQIGPLGQTQSMVQCLALLLALGGTVLVFRRLPLAYGIFVLLGLLIPLSFPTAGDPLRGLARYATVLFPLFMAFAAWAQERRLTRTVLMASAVLLDVFTVQFATWHLVAGLVI